MCCLSCAPQPPRVDPEDLTAKVGPTASRWALDTPSLEQVARFKAWAEELDRGLAPPRDAAAHGPITPLTEARALDVLAQLEQSEISLELLEASQIGRAVAMLRTQQSSPRVAACADRLARSWRATADAIIAAVASPPLVGGRTPAA